jgi:hypothetical protein
LPPGDERTGCYPGATKRDGRTFQESPAFHAKRRPQGSMRPRSTSMIRPQRARLMSGSVNNVTQSAARVRSLLPATKLGVGLSRGASLSQPKPLDFFACRSLGRQVSFFPSYSGSDRVSNYTLGVSRGTCINVLDSYEHSRTERTWMRR